MKGREGKGAAPPADLLVCFPSRAHLSLMTPKPICSPARPSEPNKRHHHHHHHNRQLRKSGTTRGGGGASQASPLLWSKNKQTGSEISEPTSPKVTCAGQIKVRPKSGACKSWQSVMEEIERIHNNNRKQHMKKRSSWVESFGFKKEIMQFLTCLRRIRFDFRCFGNFPRADITSDDDDEGEVDEEYHESNLNVEGSEENSRTVFSKWYMVLQENQGDGFCKEERKQSKSFDESEESVTSASSVPPPPNALLLMRCRSAPAKSWVEEQKEEQEQEQESVEKEVEEKENEEEEEEEGDKKKEEKKSRNLRSLMEEENINNKENLVVMRYNTDFYKLSSDIAKETWVVGGIKDLLSRSRSWKR